MPKISPLVLSLALLARSQLSFPQATEREASTPSGQPQRTTWSHQNVFHSILGPVSAPVGWRVEPCEGSAPMLCVGWGRESKGAVELLVYPLSKHHQLLSFIDAHGLSLTSAEIQSATFHKVSAAVLERFATDHLSAIEADRRASYDKGLDFQPIAGGAAHLGRLPAWSFGFVARGGDGRLLERYVNYAAFDDTALYIVAATSDPASIPRFEKDDDLVTFLPFLSQIVAGLSLPPRVEIADFARVEVIADDVPLTMVYGEGFYEVVPLGTVVTVVGRSPDRQWWRVELDGGAPAGWLPADPARVRPIGGPGS